ncbi:efflux transporter outer membrane subunit [Blastochloris sulfoviridis]|uniref:Efflux transporter outer membrane subunit n=1 Tax=Blastochloris sulfoviridis TaxID=50712 RepID=A0A5M6I4I1_9HYPH|nr:efflux transporter outer membrane subunit [Blastochloris sulfoviridis]KAA5602688.1 efflux transporter outer membrane subunit [Blastochloris sulfoviridis]
MTDQRPSDRPAAPGPRWRRRYGAAAGGLALALGLAGCAVGPDYRTPLLDLPQQYGSAKKRPAAQPAPKSDLTRWWQGLRDPILTALIDEAVAGNLDVATAKAKVREARALRRQAIGALYPNVDGFASATRNKTATSRGASSTDTAGSIASPPYTLYQAGFDASWELDLFGANRRNVEAANDALDAAWDDLDGALLTLIGDVAATYVEARGYQARAALARRTAASQRETAAITKSKFDAGSASAVDVAKATAQAASTEANIPALESAYAESVHRLGVLLGREPSALSAPLARPRSIPAPRLPLKPGVPADVLLSRPDVRAAERRLAASTANIGEAEAALYPSVTLTGNISTSAQKFGDLGKSSTIGWSWGPQLSVPIFNAGRLLAAVGVAEAQRDQSHIAFRAAVLTALEDVENALVSLAKERTRAARLSESALAYREAARLSRQLFQLGSTSFFDVLDAERSLYSAEDSLLQSRVSISTDYIALAKALGGGWTDAVDVSTPEVVDTGTGPHFYRVSQ